MSINWEEQDSKRSLVVFQIFWSLNVEQFRRVVGEVSGQRELALNLLVKNIPQVLV